ncbi:MAG: hypothetical protein R6V21_11990 [Pelovirga sp.]
MDKKLEQLFYIALGGALSMKDKLENNSEEIKKWQSEAETNARVFLDELSQRGTQEKDQVKNLLREQIKEVINELGLVTRADLEELKKDLKAK